MFLTRVFSQIAAHLVQAEDIIHTADQVVRVLSNKSATVGTQQITPTDTRQITGVDVATGLVVELATAAAKQFIVSKPESK